MPFSVDRWLGGTLTNYETVKKSIAKFKKYQQMETSGEMSKLPRKEESAIKREMGRMQRNFNGIAEMGGLPVGPLHRRCRATRRSPSPRPPAAAFPRSPSWTRIPTRRSSLTRSPATTTRSNRCASSSRRSSLRSSPALPSATRAAPSAARTPRRRPRPRPSPRRPTRPPARSTFRRSTSRSTSPPSRRQLVAKREAGAAPQGPGQGGMT